LWDIEAKQSPVLIYEVLKQRVLAEREREERRGPWLPWLPWLPSFFSARATVEVKVNWSWSAAWFHPLLVKWEKREKSQQKLKISQDSSHFKG